MAAKYKTCRCPDCGTEYSGRQRDGGHCRAYYGGCCRTYANQASADAHMYGPWENKRCYTEQELLDKGWRLTDRGWDKSGPLPPEAINRLKAKK